MTETKKVEIKKEKEKTTDPIAAAPRTADQENKRKALELALSQIEKQFGKGSIMKLEGGVIKDIDVIPTGSLALDLALGVGGVPRGRVVEIYGPNWKTFWFPNPTPVNKH